RHQRGAGVTDTAILLGTAQLVEAGGTVQHAGCYALDGGTVLVAWTGHLQHRSRDLATVIDEVSLPGTVPVLIGTPAGVILLDETGRSWSITVGPLTATPGPTSSGRSWDDAGGWHATAGARTVAAVDYQNTVAVWTPGGLGADLAVPTS